LASSSVTSWLAGRARSRSSSTNIPLLDFVRRLTALNHGRIYETDPNNIGAYVFRDFVRNRRKRLH